MTKRKETPHHDDVRESARDFGPSLDQAAIALFYLRYRWGRLGLMPGYVPGLEVAST